MDVVERDLILKKAQVQSFESKLHKDHGGLEPEGKDPLYQTIDRRR